MSWIFSLRFLVTSVKNALRQEAAKNWNHGLAHSLVTHCGGFSQIIWSQKSQEAQLGANHKSLRGQLSNMASKFPSAQLFARLRTNDITQLFSWERSPASRVPQGSFQTGLLLTRFPICKSIENNILFQLPSPDISASVCPTHHN